MTALTVARRRENSAGALAYFTLCWLGLPAGFACILGLPSALLVLRMIGVNSVAAWPLALVIGLATLAATLPVWADLIALWRARHGSQANAEAFVAQVEAALQRASHG
ncbi:MAG: hypothetical protein AAF689_17785 [Pseudomonadota bacterium]